MSDKDSMDSIRTAISDLGIEIRNISLTIEAQEILLAECLNILTAQDPGVAERFTHEGNAAFALLLDTRAPEECDILRMAFDRIAERAASVTQSDDVLEGDFGAGGARED